MGAPADGTTEANGDSLIQQLAMVVRAIGPGHTYSGALECSESTDKYGDELPYRLRIVDGKVVREDAVLVYPADAAVPAGPVATTRTAALRKWFTAAVDQYTTNADVVGFTPDEPYDTHTQHRPASWLNHLFLHIAELPGAALRLVNGVKVEVVEGVDWDTGYADGSAVLVVVIGQARIATGWLSLEDFAKPSEPGPGAKTQLDAAVEAVGAAVTAINATVEQYRTLLAAAGGASKQEGASTDGS